MSYTRKALGGVTIIFVMNAVAYAIAYLTRIVLARKLGPQDYGLFYAVFTFVIFFLFFRDLGLNPALTKYITEFRTLNKLNEIKTAILSVLLTQTASSALFASIFFLAAPFLAASYFKSPAAVMLLQLMAGYTLLSISFTFLKSFFAGFQRFAIYSLIDPAKNTIVLIIILTFFSLGLGIRAPALAYVLVGPILLLIFFPFIIKTYPLAKHKLMNFFPITKSLFLFGLPVIFTDIGDKVISYIDTLMLTHFRSLEEVGIYNVVLPSAMTLLFIGTSISSVVFPLVAELWARKDLKRLAAGIHLIHTSLPLIILPILLPFMLFPDLFLTLFFGTEYTQGSSTLQILLPGIMLFIIAGIHHSIISATGRPGSVTKIIFAAAALNAVTNLLLIPSYGINGAAFATTASYTLVFILSFISLRSSIPIYLPITVWLKTFIAAGSGIAITLLINTIVKDTWQLNPYLAAASSLMAGMVIYAFGVFSLKLVNVKELKRYISLIIEKCVDWCN